VYATNNWSAVRKPGSVGGGGTRQVVYLDEKEFSGERSNLTYRKSELGGEVMAYDKQERGRTEGNPWGRSFRLQ